ncbi:MAG TPA: signal peptide peptidase SppA [Xanthobacteraceae bacterium]|nr:signal peptide peptidase SppA [Xanthobacteraceae bacterium]
MSLDADYIVDRRRMRRKLTFWRILAVLVAIVAVVAVTSRLSRSGLGLSEATGTYIARVAIRGIIRNDQERTEALERLAKSQARAVIVHIDSPGGTAAGAEQLYDSLRAVAGSKPMVVVVDGLAASGGYIAALSADHVVARSAGLVGSVGVLFQYPNFTDLLKNVGVKVEEVKSSPLKAAPNGFEPTSPEARAALEAIVKDSYAWFRGLVKDRRQLDDAGLEQVADGRVFTGRQALALKLVDELGGEDTAVAWLAKEKNIDPKWPVRDWRLRPRFSDLDFIHLGTAAVLDAVGLRSLAQRIEDSGAVQAIEKLNLDGLLALWHPSVPD